MCSIFGYYKIKEGANPHADFVKKSLDLLRHRGPDAEDVRIYNDMHCCLGHQRLSIIDTSTEGNQPMETDSSALVFNGEIYNYLELKKEMLGSSFKTESDTEVLLRGLEQHGIEFLHQTNGMFAFGWYDTQKNVLILARDRFGVKPLYYLEQDGVLYFASEMKPLIAIKKDRKANLNVYENFLKHTATDYNEETFIEGIYAVPKGSFAVIDQTGLRIKEWYRGNDFSFDPKKEFQNKESTIQFIEDLLVNAISLRLRSDVPLCITLSGGLDSTVIYTLIKERLKIPITPFTFSHPGSATDESSLVEELVRPYGDNIRYITSDHTQGVDEFNEALSALEFPIWNPSAVAYLQMYKSIAKDPQHFKVILEGHGSDEQLGGYSYLIQSRMYELAKHGHFIKALGIGKILRQTDNAALGQKRNLTPLIIPALKQIVKPSTKENNMALALKDAFDFKILPIVLRTFDRLTMWSSLESRSPFMDYRVVEAFSKLPADYKVSSIGSKAVLREILKKYGKEHIYQRKEKMGFAGDMNKFFAVPATRAYLSAAVSRFNMPTLASYKERAEQAVAEKEWRDTGLIAKVASLTLANETYGL